MFVKLQCEMFNQRTAENDFLYSPRVRLIDVQLQLQRTADGGRQQGATYTQVHNTTIQTCSTHFIYTQSDPQGNTHTHTARHGALNMDEHM